MITLCDTVAGSRLYGLERPESDTDTMGIGIATRQEKCGLRCPDQKGADDHVVYELSKWARLVLNGNPTVTQILFTPRSHWLQWHEEWEPFQIEARDVLINQRVKPAFLGYLDGQRKKILSERQQRSELIAKHGYDTKFAMHMVRLGYQGVQLLREGRLDLPMDPMAKHVCQQIRDGQMSKQACLDLTANLEQVMMGINSSPLPAESDAEKVDEFLEKWYSRFWF